MASYRKLTVPQLKQKLKEYGLKTSGKKAELVNRLTERTKKGKATSLKAAFGRSPQKRQSSKRKNVPASGSGSHPTKRRHIAVKDSKFSGISPAEAVGILDEQRWPRLACEAVAPSKPFRE